MKTMRYLFASVLFAIACVASPAHASSNTTEITDMWWNPSESGWGINIILQNSVAFATFFLYDANRNPVWYTAELHYQGNFVWSGPLYVTSGPGFGGPFPSGATTIRQAGTATFSLLALNQATLTYSVGDIAVTKTVQRQTWTNETYTGSYAGGYSLRMSGCNPSSLNGVQEVAGLLSINQVGTTITMSTTSSGANCNFTGTYSQAGKLGAVAGSYSCSDGTGGTFALIEMTPTVSGFTSRASGQNQYCQWTGFVGGIARAQ